MLDCKTEKINLVVNEINIFILQMSNKEINKIIAHFHTSLNYKKRKPHSSNHIIHHYPTSTNNHSNNSIFKSWNTLKIKSPYLETENRYNPEEHSIKIEQDDEQRLDEERYSRRHVKQSEEMLEKNCETNKTEQILANRLQSHIQYIQHKLSLKEKQIVKLNTSLFNLNVVLQEKQEEIQKYQKKLVHAAKQILESKKNKQQFELEIQRLKLNTKIIEVQKDIQFSKSKEKILYKKASISEGKFSNSLAMIRNKAKHMNSTIINLNKASVQNRPFKDYVQKRPLKDSVQKRPLKDSVQKRPLKDSVQKRPLKDSVQKGPLTNDRWVQKIKKDMKSVSTSTDEQKQEFLDNKEHINIQEIIQNFDNGEEHHIEDHTLSKIYLKNKEFDYFTLDSVTISPSNQNQFHQMEAKLSNISQLNQLLKEKLKQDETKMIELYLQLEHSHSNKQSANQRQRKSERLIEAKLEKGVQADQYKPDGQIQDKMLNKKSHSEIKQIPINLQILVTKTIESWLIFEAKQSRQQECQTQGLWAQRSQIKRSSSSTNEIFIKQIQQLHSQLHEKDQYIQDLAIQFKMEITNYEEQISNMTANIEKLALVIEDYERIMEEDTKYYQEKMLCRKCKKAPHKPNPPLQVIHEAEDQNHVRKNSNQEDSKPNSSQGDRKASNQEETNATLSHPSQKGPLKSEVKQEMDESPPKECEQCCNLTLALEENLSNLKLIQESYITLESEKQYFSNQLEERTIELNQLELEYKEFYEKGLQLKHHYESQSEELNQILRERDEELFIWKDNITKEKQEKQAIIERYEKLEKEIISLEGTLQKINSEKLSLEQQIQEGKQRSQKCHEKEAGPDNHCVDERKGRKWSDFSKKSDRSGIRIKEGLESQNMKMEVYSKDRYEDEGKQMFEDEGKDSEEEQMDENNKKDEQSLGRSLSEGELILDKHKTSSLDEDLDLEQFQSQELMMEHLGQQYVNEGNNEDEIIELQQQ